MRLKSLARMLSLALTTSVAPSAIAQPTAGLFAPLSTTGTKDRLPGKFIFSQLITPSLEVAEQFYGQMFGWTFRAVEARNMRYAEIFNGDRPIGTIVERPLPPGDRDHPYWMPFVSTTDTDETARLAQASGGKILFKPHDIPGLGRETVVADPQSGIFVALHSQNGDPEDTLPVAGEWIWSSLLSPAPEKSATFYHNLFGYLTAPTTGHKPADTSQKVDVETADHVILSSQDHDRGSINPLPSGMSPDAPARWLRFIRVDSAKAAADKAVALKGRIISGPRVDHDGATVAVLADPSGAVFGVLEWHEAGQPQEMTP